MLTTQMNRINMFKAVDSYLHQNSLVWETMETMVAGIAQLGNKINAIDVAAQKQDMPTSGAVLDKASARDALEDILFLNTEALGVLGHTTNDGNLIALSDVSRSALDSMTDEQLTTRATNILSEVNNRATGLAAMNVTSASITEFTNALNNFNAAKVQPRTAVADRKAQTESLPSLIRDTSNLLRNQIDRLVNLFSRSHPDFVAGYKGARVIIDRAATRETKPTVPPPPVTP
jgi:hypothetical protein